MLILYFTFQTNTRRKYGDKETDAFRYASLKLYATVKSRSVFDFLYSLGAVISYQGVRQMLNRMAMRSLVEFQRVKALVPFSLRNNMFTIGAVDNIDKSAKSTSGDAFHGTSFSIFQQAFDG